MHRIRILPVTRYRWRSLPTTWPEDGSPTATSEQEQQLPVNETRTESVKVRRVSNRCVRKCKVIRRHKRVLVICENPRHKQRQG